MPRQANDHRECWKQHSGIGGWHLFVVPDAFSILHLMVFLINEKDSPLLGDWTFSSLTQTWTFKIYFHVKWRTFLKFIKATVDFLAQQLGLPRLSVH